jgi:hypothetical protein
MNTSIPPISNCRQAILPHIAQHGARVRTVTPIPRGDRILWRERPRLSALASLDDRARLDAIADRTARRPKARAYRRSGSWWRPGDRIDHTCARPGAQVSDGLDPFPMFSHRVSPAIVGEREFLTEPRYNIIVVNVIPPADHVNRLSLDGFASRRSPSRAY